MAQTAEQLRQKSENIIAGIKNMVKNLKQVNAEIVAKQSATQANVENIKAKHEMELAELNIDNEMLTALIEDNQKFIESIESIFNYPTEAESVTNV